MAARAARTTNGSADTVAANTAPVSVNTSGAPNTDCHALPSDDCVPNKVSK